MSVTNPLPKIALFYKEGTSDKEYHLEVKQSTTNSGYFVEYRYGRRGSALKTSNKNKMSVDLDSAISIFEKERDKQLREGYTTGEEGTPYTNSEDAGRVSGLLPQLLNYCSENEVEMYINDDSWVMQEKKDGVRQMIKKHGKVVDGVNRKGLTVSIPTSVEQSIRAAVGVADCTLDGEAVGEVYWVFDILSISVHAFADKTYRERLNAIQEWLEDGWTANFQMIPTAVGKASKRSLYARLKEENAEGVVFSKLDAPYKAGRPASGGTRLKFKFKATATVRVRAVNQQNSFQMELLSKGDWTYVGDCTYFPTIAIPKPGELWEVEYLYVKQVGGCLFQPEPKGKRDDVDEDACVMSQLKYAQGVVEDDDN